MQKIINLLILVLLSNMTNAQLKEIKYKDGSQSLTGMMAKPESAKKGVLILPAWQGIDDEAKQAALNLQKQGYIAFIADIYGDGNKPKNNAEAKVKSSYYKENYKNYQQRIKAALEELVKQGADFNHVAIIGYCFGGTGALEAARAQLPVNAVVSIHGGLSKGDRPNGPISTKVLVLHGAEDQSVPEADVEALRNELKQAKADWQLIYYANSKHTFTNPASPDYNVTMSKRSWQHLLLFLDEVL
ncbi:dienelactone hydrolase family protein [Pseudopedobacter sp.]|uniref:dienelactone hydrolase family protein n=1 Tax=Pseudopedobacter sp. TaxID=1936787 RepID=UPI0033422A78